MVWFVCDSCGDTIKKPKVPQHLYQCHASSLTCVDCSRTFDRGSYAAHTTCVTESQKYAEGATKPGGFAAKGFYEASGGKSQAAAAAEDPSQDEFLATRPPWKCNVCNVSCTSQETLHAHASGKKHMRRAQAARNAAQAGSSDAAPSSQAGTNGMTAAVVNGVQRSLAASARPEANGAAGAEPPSTAATPSGAPTAAEAAQAKGGSKSKQRKYKWKAIAAELLRANGGMLKLKKLQSKALKSAQYSEDVSKAALKADMLAKWKSSSQFEVGEDHVKLKSC